MSSHHLVDRLVEHLNSGDPTVVFDIDCVARAPLDVERNPRFQARPSFSWPEALLAELPETLAYLLKSYVFPPVVLGPVLLYANTGGGTRRELRELTESTNGWSGTLRKAGYIELGKPSDGSSDAICLDARSSCAQREYPLVRLDHELLLKGKIHPVEIVAGSFVELFESILADGDTEVRAVEDRGEDT